MWKSIIILGVCFVAVIVAVVVLQPSPEEAALANLDAAQKVLDEVKSLETPAKFEDARKALASTKLSGDSQKLVTQALGAIDDLEATVEAERAKLSAISSEIRSQISQAKANLPSSSAVERAKTAKDQLLALLWPLVLVLLVLYVLHSKGTLTLVKQLATTVSNVKIPGGLEIAFHSNEVKSSQEETLQEYREQVIRKYDAAANQYQIGETVARIAEGPIANFFKTLPEKKFRCTVHMRDILFDNSLYQLIDYIGAGKGGRGRAWSVRRGMIGRCWRLEKSDIQSSVTKDKIELIDRWGLIKNEVDYVNRNQSVLCCLIKAQNQNPVALFYLDSEPEGAFGNKAQMDAFQTIVENAIKTFKLDESLERVWQQVQGSAPLIEIYADHR